MRIFHYGICKGTGLLISTVQKLEIKVCERRKLGDVGRSWEELGGVGRSSDPHCMTARSAAALYTPPAKFSML